VRISNATILKENIHSLNRSLAKIFRTYDGQPFKETKTYITPKVFRQITVAMPGAREVVS
jgi:hypothetical protein